MARIQITLYSTSAGGVTVERMYEELVDEHGSPLEQPIRQALGDLTERVVAAQHAIATRTPKAMR